MQELNYFRHHDYWGIKDVHVFQICVINDGIIETLIKH